MLFRSLCKILTAIFRILWHHLHTDMRNVECIVSSVYVHLLPNRCRKQGPKTPNRCIIGDTILPETGTKFTKKRGSKFGTRSVVAPADAAEKNRNIGAQLQSILYTTAQKRFRKIYFLYDFWCAQTCSFRAIFGLPIQTSTLAVSTR